MKKLLVVVLALSALLLSSACNKKNDSVTETKPEQATEQVTEQATEKPQVKLSLSDEELGAFADIIENEYKSFEVISIEAPDFFVNKELRLAAIIQDHNMSNVYSLGATAKFSDSTLVINMPGEDGKTEKNEFILYSVSEEIKKSPSGEDFVYAAYGTEEITSAETDGAISIVCCVQMRDDIDMGDAAADRYVLMMETSTPDAYQIYKIEE